MVRASVTGGLEAVLDEHTAATSLTGSGTPLEVLDCAFVGRSGWVPRRITRVEGQARIHAAVAYLTAEGRGRGDAARRLRSDTLRHDSN